MTPFAVELKGLAKSFGSCAANRAINLTVKKGSIHGIVGENGAGKSTAMNMLYGLYPPDNGEIWVNGTKRHFKSPTDALECGIGMVHQHFVLSLEENAVDNILLGHETLSAPFSGLPNFLKFCGPIDRASALQKLRSLADRYGLEVPWDLPVGELNVGQQQRIEILKLLYRDAQILILDEPTAVLTPQETEQIFIQLKALASQGKSIILITHKLKEVISLCDEITVFRAGSVVGFRTVNETSESDLAELMVGRHIDLHSKNTQRPATDVRPLLEIKNLNLKAPHGQPLLKNISLSIRPGEILGIAGVQGNGQSELHHVICDPLRYFQPKLATGTIEMNEKSIVHLTTQDLFKMGVAAVYEDRLKESVIAGLPLWENFALGLHRFPRFSTSFKLSIQKIKEALKSAIQIFDIKTENLDNPLQSLSGGNQQKIVLARELEKNPKVLIVSQPTRGVDIGAIEFIHEQIKVLQSKGAAILLISSELSELLSLSQRIAVFYKGEVLATFDAHHCSEKDLGLAMGGTRVQPSELSL